MIKFLKKLDRKLLPEMGRQRYLSYIWLVYLSIYYISLIAQYGEAAPYFESILATLLFLFFYFHGFWVKPKWVCLDIIAILLIGSYLLQITSGSSVFFIYAFAYCCRLGSVNNALAGMLAIVIWVALLSYLYSASLVFFAPAIGFGLMVGGVNIYQHEIGKKKLELALSQNEIKLLAKTAERERIARDLHDLIGHTFSVITLKAELANKLIDKDLSKARNEINELENISRDALSQVREVITGYRTSDLTTELAHAKYVLETNEVDFSYNLQDFDMSDAINKELAIILKELVTNVLKHSDATKVSANIRMQGESAVLTFSDDGSAKEQEPNKGFGLTGIKERINNLSGNYSLDSANGWRFTVEVPLKFNMPVEYQS